MNACIDKNAREKFAESMCFLHRYHVHFFAGCENCKQILQAIDAFADVDCGAYRTWKGGENDLGNIHDHIPCRAALRKTCGMEER